MGEVYRVFKEMQRDLMTGLMQIKSNSPGSIYYDIELHFVYVYFISLFIYSLYYILIYIK